MKIIPLRDSLPFAAILAAAVLACAPVQAKTQENLFDMAEQLDQMDKQDFQAAIDRANDCTRARDFSCSEKELAKAAKVANGGKDKKILAAARQGVVGEKARIAEEQRQRAEQARRREEEARQLAEAMEERERQARREAEEREGQREEREYAGNSSAETYAAMMDGINKNFESIDRMNRQALASVREINRAQAERAAAQKHANAERKEREAEQRGEARRNEEARQSREKLAQADVRDRENQSRAEAERAAERQRQEREAQQREEQRRRDEQAQQERASEREKQRQREEADRLAKKQAEQAAEQQAKEAYLAAMKQGIRLRVVQEFDPSYRATGSMPKIKKVLFCIDVYYQASCPGSRVTSNGVLTNFIGWGMDNSKIEPKPACALDQVRIEVTDVRPGCN
jgi:hypothetical protein